ncbi:MAG: FUSC family protein, partial [Propionibacteriaceae bacterium]|nr:FUSC family protein [Propionibacteriaceae bacterium]
MSTLMAWLRRWWRLFVGRVSDGWGRLRTALVPNTQTAIVATIAYAICHWGLGHEVPVFGPVACFMAMGYNRSRSPRRVVEMGLGATVGIGIGELFAQYAGFNVVSLLIVLLVAPLIGRFVDHSELLTYQAAMQSVIVVGMAATSALTGPAALGRWVDALVGTACAFLFTVIHPNRSSATAL